MIRNLPLKLPEQIMLRYMLVTICIPTTTKTEDGTQALLSAGDGLLITRGIIMAAGIVLGLTILGIIPGTTPGIVIGMTHGTIEDGTLRGIIHGILPDIMADGIRLGMVALGMEVDITPI